MRSQFNSLCTRAVLQRIDESQGVAAVSAPDDRGVPSDWANVCARVPEGLSEQISEAARFCGISKRRFIEACLVEGLRQLEEVSRSEGVPEDIGYFAVPVDAGPGGPGGERRAA